jgi:hypothetical protein
MYVTNPCVLLADPTMANRGDRDRGLRGDVSALGLRVFVAGASSGIDRELASQLSAQGARWRHVLGVETVLRSCRAYVL